jgi:hypothetical protein
MREPRKGRTTGTFRTVSHSHRPRRHGCVGLSLHPVLVGSMWTSYAAATICGSVLARSRLQDVYRNRDTSTSPVREEPIAVGLPSLARVPEPSSFRQSFESRGPGYDPGSRSGCRLIPSSIISSPRCFPRDQLVWFVGPRVIPWIGYAAPPSTRLIDGAISLLARNARASALHPPIIIRYEWLSWRHL